MDINTSHPLIPNSQEYFVYKKYISVHSEDIDTSKYPDNCFEIELPEDYLNVLCVKLTDITLPPNIYNFSQALGNTTIFFDISLNMQNVSLSATVPDAFYSKQNILAIITNLANAMNNAVNTFLGITTPANSYQNFSGNQSGSGYIIQNVGSKLYPATSFTFTNNYINPLCLNTQLYSTNGTLYHILGFTGYSTESSFTGADYFINIGNINYDAYSFIYMEVDILNDTLNNMDEIVVYKKNNYSLRNNGNSGIVNSAFAKIPVNNFDELNTVDFCREFFYNYKYFNPPAERIRKLKIKFRFHNNVLVNFNGGSYTFLLEFTLYNKQILRSYNVSRPVIHI